MTAALDAGARLALAIVAWLLGIALQLQQARLWPEALYIAGLALALATLPVARWRLRVGRSELPAMALICIALGAAAFCSTGWRAGARLAEQLPAALQGQDLLLTGAIAALPRSAPDGRRFVFEVEHARHLGEPVQVPARVALGWYGGFASDTTAAESVPELRAGQRWQLLVRLRLPHGNLNPHGFDYELWLFERGIRATGSVRGGDANQLLGEAVAHPVERLRQRIGEAMTRRLGDTAAAGVLAALAVGDQAAIERDDWELFRRTGVAHLMSISGLHVTMFAWLAGGLLGLAWRRSRRLMLTVPTPLAARWAGVLAAAAYALLAGWGIPAQRTLWMLVTLALLRSFGVRWPAPLGLLVAALVVMLVDPWALLQPGFWLSFVAVGLLMGARAEAQPRAGSMWLRVRRGLRAGARTQLVASIGLAPLSMVFFQQVSLVGFVANMVAIPLVTLLITPLALLGIAWGALWTLGSWLVQALMSLLNWLSQWPGAVWSASAAPWWAAASGLLGAGLLVLPGPWRMRLLGIPLLLPLLLPPPLRAAAGQFEMLAADVGQGTAVLLRTREHVLLYDSGPRYSAEADAGQRVLLPLLRALGVSKIDLLVLSHSDNDHVGGAVTLLAHADVDALSSSLPATHPLQQLARRHERCAAGQAWQWDGVDFEMLHPLSTDYAGDGKSNALSCVLRVRSADGAAVLLTGDIEAPQEAVLVQREGAALQSQVLLVPHHGSRTSSSAQFLHAVAPQVAVAQAGYRSRYGHPAPAVVERYRALGIRFERSDDCGAWSWSSDGAADHCERQRQRRYWHDRPADAAGPGR